MSSRPVRDPGDPLPEEPTPAQPCSFCSQTPTGATGHEGLALEVHKLQPNVRTLICVPCFFCGTRWARRRLSAKQFQWHRVIG